MMEVWKYISEGYEVSDHGQVRSLDRFRPIGLGRMRPLKGRILKLGKHNQGYLTAQTGRNNTNLIHRLVAAAFIEKPEGKDFVNHIDGDKHNNHVSNLEWCTRQENEDHAFGTGLKNSTGSANEMAKLTEEKVTAIKRLRYMGSKNITLSKIFNVHIATISRIIAGETWKHVTI